MIYVDSCIPMYLVGADHPNKRRVVEVAAQLVHARDTLVTSAETFQEIIHRYKAIEDPAYLKLAYDALEAIVHRTENITKADTDGARTWAIEYPALSSRDCLHLAVMSRMNCFRIWTFDQAFASIPKIITVA